ncbi:MAG: hypothetical protein GKR89_06695 [Candidatus Latescibacteria bacterium]|nr:hypothetical protein [Candidatus Latescibacterota bacterium]
MRPLSFADPTAFLARTSTFLHRDEPYNNLLLGIVLRLQRGNLATPAPLLVAVEEGEEVVLAGAMTPPRKLILYGETSGSGGLEALVRHLLEQGWTVPGVLAPVGLARSFAQIWHQVSGQPMRQKMRQGVYQLRRVLDRGSAPGYLRPAAAADIGGLTKWAAAFSQDIGEGPMPPQEARAHVEAVMGRGDLFVWDQGGPVSMAARARPTTHGMVINMVYTPLLQRGRGYATACVAALSQLILDQGRDFCALFTDLDNPTSNHIYQQIGYEWVGEFGDCEFTAV